MTSLIALHEKGRGRDLLLGPKTVMERLKGENLC